MISYIICIQHERGKTLYGCDDFDVVGDWLVMSEVVDAKLTKEGWEFGVEKLHRLIYSANPSLRIEVQVY